MAEVLLENLDCIAYITLNNPDKHNALSPTLINALQTAIISAEQNADISWIILRANGKNFCAGADLEWLKSGASLDTLAYLLKTMHDLTKPILAYVKGAALAGAMGILAVCDVVLADKKAVFGLSEVNLGLVPAMITPYLLQAIGLRHTKRLALAAERINADEAKLIGLIHSIVTYEEFVSYVQNLKTASPDALKQCKTMCNYLNNKPIKDKLIQATIKIISDIRKTPDAKKRIANFLSRRELK
jgi:methylglutaconyl-CoA hydratase